MLYYYLLPIPQIPMPAPQLIQTRGWIVGFMGSTRPAAPRKTAAGTTPSKMSRTASTNQTPQLQITVGGGLHILFWTDSQFRLKRGLQFT